MTPIRTICLRLRRRAFELRGNNEGLAAVEFAMIIPLMAMLLLGTYEFSTGVAIDRKVTIMARTLSDLFRRPAPAGPSDLASADLVEARGRSEEG